MTGRPPGIRDRQAHLSRLTPLTRSASPLLYNEIGCHDCRCQRLGLGCAHCWGIAGDCVSCQDCHGLPCAVSAVCAVSIHHDHGCLYRPVVSLHSTIVSHPQVPAGQWPLLYVQVSAKALPPISCCLCPARDVTAAAVLVMCGGCQTCTHPEADSAQAHASQPMLQCYALHDNTHVHILAQEQH